MIASEDYEPSRLRCLVSSLERHLKKNDYPVSIINNKQFELARKSLQSNKKSWRKQAVETSLKLLY